MSLRWLRRAKAVIRNPHFWVILILLVFCTISHYPEALGLVGSLSFDSVFGLTRHAVERVLYIVLMIYAGYIWGLVAGLVTTFITLLLMLPRALFISASPADALLETGMATLVGVLANLWFWARVNQVRIAVQREQAIATMTTAQEKLRAQIRSTIKRERELTTLSQLSSSLAESLETEPLLRSAIDMVMEVMRVEVLLIFTLEEETKQLVLKSYKGAPPEFAQAIDRMRVGEGFNGRVAETGEPLLVEDTSRDPRLIPEAVRRENLQTLLTVPMKSRGKVVGTLCVAMRQPRTFAVEEVELLTAIANQVGVGIENARLTQQQLIVTEQLSRSEKHYRELFECAHDAIWVHDLEGNILTANRATEILTGYSIEELTKMKVRDFLSPEGLSVAREVRVGLLTGQTRRQPYEQRLIRRGGTEAILMLTTNLITRDGEPQAFQNIGRDITEEKRMQENLHSYVQQITRAQEEERLRIARELHDSTAQNLIALLHRLENFLHVQAELPIEKVRELWAFHEQTKDILQEIRSLSRHLRPSVLDDVGLLPAVHLLVREMKTEYSIETSLQVYGTERRFPQEVEIVLFRIVQEALRNVGKHSHASHAEVLIRFEEAQTTIIVRDNGVGFQIPEKISDLSRGGKLGLVGVQERVQLLGGSLEVKSQLGKGTWVIIKAPI